MRAGPGPEDAVLTDAFGRTVDDFRISVTGACDLRCWFCHHEGNVSAPGRTMRPEEIETLARVASRLGVRFCKLTGGEPLLRRDIVEIARRLSPLFEELSMVTNGRHLASRARALRDAGLRRVNVSLHSLNPDFYRATTGGSVEPALEGIAAAVAAGLDPVKINVVATQETLADLDTLLSWASAHGVGLQFIELHAPPSTSARALRERVPLSGLEAELARRADRVTKHRLHDRNQYHLAGTMVIVTRPQGNETFCAACTRLRLTHDGYVKPCLMRADNYIDALGPLRAGATDDELVALFAEASRRRVPFWPRPVPAAVPNALPVLARVT